MLPKASPVLGWPARSSQRHAAHLHQMFLRAASARWRIGVPAHRRTGYLDYVPLPALAFPIGLTIYVIWLHGLAAPGASEP